MEFSYFDEFKSKDFGITRGIVIENLLGYGLIRRQGHTDGYTLTKEGWNFDNFENEKKSKTNESERNRYDLLGKRFIYNWRWWPYGLSAFAVIVSIFAYFKKQETNPAVLQQEIKKQLELTRQKAEPPVSLLGGKSKDTLPSGYTKYPAADQRVNP